MTSWWSTKTDGSSSEESKISRDSYTPVPLAQLSVPPPPLTESLIERARLQYRIWQDDLTKPGITPLHMTIMLANIQTLHTLLCSGIYCPKETMKEKEVNPIMLISSQPDDNSANMCLKMFLNALQACETVAIEPIGVYKYVACKQCFRKTENKPVEQKSEKVLTPTSSSSTLNVETKKGPEEKKPKNN